MARLYVNSMGEKNMTKEPIRWAPAMPSDGSDVNRTMVKIPKKTQHGVYECGHAHYSPMDAVECPKKPRVKL